VVTVSVHGENGSVVLAVSDSGPGIPTDERPRVFERFYRMPDSTVPGTGLGLSIVQDVARLHDAVVEIGTGPDERGTRVAVRFRAL
jgi:signal transduction histidine kinase